MPEPVRRTREHLTRELGLSQRLATRLGAWLKHQLGCTASVLEEARENERLEKLLLHPDLRTADETFAAHLTALLTQQEFASFATDLPLILAREGDWRVLAFAEELEAEAGFEEGVEAEEEPAPSGAPLLPAASSAAPLAPAFPEGNAAPAAFSPAQLAELRVAVFAGTTSADRIAALRRLAFAPLPEGEKEEIFLQALAEEEGDLRAAAAHALQRLGWSAEVAEPLRLLATGETAERDYACRRLGSGAASAEGRVARAAVMALLGALRAEREADLRALLVETLALFAPRLPDFRARAGEILRFLLEQVVGDPERLGPAVRQTLRSFESAAPGTVAPFLLEEAGKTSALRIRAYLLGVAVGLPCAPGSLPRLRTAAADCLAALPAESPDSHLLGSFLVDQGDAGAEELLARLEGAELGHQRFFIRLLDNAARFRPLGDAVRVRAAERALALLRAGARTLCHDLLETRLLAPEALLPAAREEMARALLPLLRDFQIPRAHENAENVLVRLGLPALPALLDAIREQPAQAEGRVACRAAGRLALEAKSGDAGDAPLLHETLRTLQRVTFTSAGQQLEVYVAMGQLVGSGRIDETAAKVVRQNLLGRLAGGVEDAPVIKALGWLAAGPAESAETLGRVAARAMEAIEHDAPDSTFETAWVDGQEVYSFGGGFDVHSELLPACLGAIGHVLRAPKLETAVRDDLVRRLLARWKECASFRVQWSPGNLTRLTALLGSVGREEGLGDALRGEIVHTLALKMGDLPVLEALADILAEDRGGRELDRLAAAVVLKLLKILEPLREAAAEEREMYLRVLGRVAGRGRFEARGGQGARLLQRALEEVALGVRAGVPGAIGQLLNLRDNPRLPGELRDSLADLLRQYTALARR